MTRVRNFVFIAIALFAIIALSAFGLVLSGTELSAQAAETVVYLSGNGGLDTNGGTSATDAVKTFGKAKEILDGADGRIVVTGQINVTKDEEWTAGVGQKIKIVKDATLRNKLIAVYAGAVLYIKDIEISGGGTTSATDAGYLIDIENGGVKAAGKLAVEGRVIVGDATDGKNIHLPADSVIEIRGALTGGLGSICIKAENNIGDEVFERKVAEGTSDYEVTENDSLAFREVSDLTHDNIINTEVRDNAVLFSVSPENRINLTLRQVTDKGAVISEETKTVVKGSRNVRPYEFLPETDSIPNVPKNLTHIKSVTLNGGENLAVRRTDGTFEENNNDVIRMKGEGTVFEKTAAFGWRYRFASAEEDSVIEVVYEPDAFAVSFDARGGAENFSPYLVPYGTADPDCFGDRSISEFTPTRSGYIYTGYRPSDGSDYSVMPDHGISYTAGWRIKDIEIAVSGATTVKIGKVIALSSTAVVYRSVQYRYCWYKDGVLLADETDSMIFLSKVEQSGSYVLQIIAADPLGYAPSVSATSAAVLAKIERFGAEQEEKPDVPPTVIETDDPLPKNAVLSIESLSAGNASIKTPLGYRAAGRFFARLTADGKDIVPKKNVTVKIKLDGALLSDESLTIVMVGKDGEPTYREFRIEDGMLIFETDTLGEFAIFVKTAVPWWAWIIIACGALVLVSAAVIFAVYKKMRTISFDTDGGTAVKKKFVLAGHRVPKLPAPVKNGSDFAGWYLDEEKTQSFDYKSMPKADVTLYAKWRPKFGGKNDTNA